MRKTQDEIDCLKMVSRTNDYKKLLNLNKHSADELIDLYIEYIPFMVDRIYFKHRHMEMYTKHGIFMMNGSKVHCFEDWLEIRNRGSKDLI